MKGYYIILSYLLFVGCRERSNIKLNEKRNSRVQIDKSHFLYGDTKNGLLQCFFNDTVYKIGQPYSIFNKYGQLLSHESKSNLGYLTINEFEDGEIYRSRKYLWDSSIKDYRPQELKVYENGMVKRDESDFVNVVIVSKKDDELTLEIEFISGFNFVSGKILFGNAINDFSDIESLKEIEFNRNKALVKINESEILFGENMTFQCFVEIVTDTLVKHKQIDRTYSGKNWKSRYLIKK